MIETLTPQLGVIDNPLRAPAQQLLRQYGAFLKASGSHDNFRYDLLEQEIATLPVPYTESGGAFLVATDKGSVSGCIAYRQFAERPGEGACELKRLYVRPSAQGRGIGSELITAAMDHARSRGYTMAYLDTDPVTMPAALHAYRKLGFVEYDADTAASCPSACLLFLRRAL